jgi:hypothetical protein
LEYLGLSIFNSYFFMPWALAVGSGSADMLGAQAVGKPTSDPKIAEIHTSPKAPWPSRDT